MMSYPHAEVERAVSSRFYHISARAHLDGVLRDVLAAFAPADHQASLSTKAVSLHMCPLFLTLMHSCLLRSDASSAGL